MLAPLVHALCGRVLEPRVATYLPIRAGDGGLIDKGLALHFPAPHSYTGEDVLELQIHGGSVVLQLLLDRVLMAGQNIDRQTGVPTLPGIRLAAPGEFTQRAFLNGKIDLVQAEAIADLIDASTEAAARGASRSLVGEFSQEVGDIKTALVRLRMLVEATLDFPEEDIDFLQKADARGQLQALQALLVKVMQRTRQGALLREGIKVVIAGQPNAGKSSLLNALAGAELAIVTPVAGTTRDKIQQTIQISGVPVHVVDTAGLRDSEDVVEKLGVERAWEEIGGADAVVFLHDLTRFDAADYAAADQRIRTLLTQRLAASIPIIDVWNKADIAKQDAHVNGQSVLLSAKTGVGLADLRAKLLNIAGWQAGAEGTYIARARHVRALDHVAAHLAAADQHLVQTTQALDLLAEELRLGQNALSEILGEFTSDDLLGVIFSSFCIGK
jgi:tRNA modification GTPase